MDTYKAIWDDLKEKFNLADADLENLEYPKSEKVYGFIAENYFLYGDIPNLVLQGLKHYLKSRQGIADSKQEMNGEQRPVEIFADGACYGNPGPGGFGVLIRFPDGESEEISGMEAETTNNRMELIGVITALESIKNPCNIKVTIDSEYIVKGMTEWMQGWIKRGWKNSQRVEVINRDLWERLLNASGPHKIDWNWTKSHSGHSENERCDELARLRMEECREIGKKGMVSRAP